MGRTDWLASLRAHSIFNSSRRHRLRRTLSVEALERRAAPSDAFGLISGATALGGSLATGADLDASLAESQVSVPRR
ncbi:MAG: hypothetical protein M3552_19135, partial [Planctomycetota bacterium]|nr:hypothetical protein [Planctomycetota bacterium]